MDGWSPVCGKGRIAALLETGTVGAVRDLFPYGVRILCPITLHTGRDVAGWSSWHEVAERVGAQYPPRRGLTSMIDSANTPVGVSKHHPWAARSTDAPQVRTGSRTDWTGYRGPATTAQSRTRSSRAKPVAGPTAANRRAPPRDGRQ